MPHLENASRSFSQILGQAAREIGYREHVAVGGEVTGISQRAAATAGFLDLRDMALPPVVNSELVRSGLAVSEVPAGKTVPLAAAIVEKSLIAQAGARIIIVAERPVETQGDVIAFYRDSGAFVIVEPSLFAAVSDGADAANSDLPFASASIQWDDAPSAAFSTTITRRQQKDFGFNIDAELLKSIIAGLSREADRVLLSAIAAAAPNEFSLAAAAARGLEFAELRALVGTAGNGAAVENGVIYAYGIQAELTPSISETIVGAFNRAAVAIHPKITVAAERLNVHGDVRVTCFANLLGLVPDSSAFWTVE